MAAIMMPGAPVAEAVFQDLKPRIDALVANGHTPGLATILVGSDEPRARVTPMQAARGQATAACGCSAARRASIRSDTIRTDTPASGEVTSAAW